MKDREFITAVITDKNERTVRLGHPWVYGEEITSISGEPQNGELVDVTNKKGAYLGTGFYNSNSKIRVRIISKNANDKFDEAFFARRVRYALDYRKTVMANDYSACRLIFGEADFLPGLTVDRFNNVLVTEVACLGTEKVKDMINRALIAALKDDGVEIIGIYERNEVALREKEGLPLYKGWYDFGSGMPMMDGKEITETEIVENGIKYAVDFINGQKTGFFLDQKYNRKAVAELCDGKTVLDCFTHTGSFALNAAKGGASEVIAADISETAINQAKRNASLNGLENKIDFRIADIFDLLPELEKSGKKFDVVILDPPAFTKSRKTVNSALRGYGEINFRAMKLVKRSGYFATCSCSHFATTELFIKAVCEAAGNAGVNLRQVEARQQAPDHPILWNVPETDYLKFFIFQVV